MDKARPPEPEIPGSSPGQLKVIVSGLALEKFVAVPTLPEHRLPRQDVSACAGTGCPKTRRQAVALTVQLTNAWRLPAPRDHD